MTLLPYLVKMGLSCEAGGSLAKGKLLLSIGGLPEGRMLIGAIGTGTLGLAYRIKKVHDLNFNTLIYYRFYIVRYQLKK